MPHQKSRFFIARKGVDLSLDVWPLRNALKPFLPEYMLAVGFIISLT